jgi:succinate dehydrogenase hydrophobic anchor subunit
MNNQYLIKDYTVPDVYREELVLVWLFAMVFLFAAPFFVLWVESKFKKDIDKEKQEE